MKISYARTLILILFMAIPRVQGEESRVQKTGSGEQKIENKGNDLTLGEKGVVTLIICGLFYYGYEKERQRVEGEEDIIGGIKVDGESVDTEGVNATPYIIGASIPIGWFLSEWWDHHQAKKRAVTTPED